MRKWTWKTILVQPTCTFFSRLQYYFLFSLFILFLSPLFCNCAFITIIFLIGTPPTFLLLNTFYFLLWLLQSLVFLFLIFILFHLVLFATVSLSFDTFIACLCCFLPIIFLSPQTSSFSQYWNTGGSHPEELVWPGAHPGFQARPQSSLLYSFASSKPQFTDCVAVFEHCIPGG